MEVQAINGASPHLQAVKTLWRPHSGTLGYLPDGAFDEHADKKRILVALDGGKLIGYLLYRIVRNRVAIVQFCVDPAVRRKGCAKALLNHLRECSKHTQGIGLHCRSDFEDASKAWEGLGFSAIKEKLGRATDGSTLIYWWMGHGQKSLFDDSSQSDVLRIGIDYNVFVDLVENNQKSDSIGLKADWIQPFIKLHRTPEHANEVRRAEDSAIRSQRRSQLQEFELFDPGNEKFQQAEATLQPLFPDLKRDSDKSDFRHLVWTLAADGNAFVSRDGPLLEKADDVFKVCGLRVMRPADLIVDLDVVQSEKDYQRNYLAGTNVVSRKRIDSSDNSLVLRFLLPDERKHGLRDELNRCLADPKRCHCHTVADGDDIVAMFAVEHDPSVHRVPIFRICNNRRAGTFARAMLTNIMRQATKEQAGAVFVTEPNLSDAAQAACTELGFLAVDGGWVKLLLAGWNLIDDVSNMLHWSDARIDELKATLPAARIDPHVASRIEHLLWPCKLADAALRCFIVPIRPHFAEHLFEERLASSGVLGAEPALALNPESAYYRAARPAVLASPGRVLWYVSGKGSYAGSKAIRACSRIVEVAIGTPSVLFRRFRRLGVYEWPEVLETAKGNHDRDVMAFRFDDSELLRPMHWNEFQEILTKHGAEHPLPSPAEIPAAAFGEIYVASINPPEVR